MPNYPRMFAYFTAAVTTGLLIYVFTNLFLPFTQSRDWVGTAFLLAFGLVYLSLAAAFARRFVSKTSFSFAFPYALIPLLILPMAIITHLQDKFALVGDQVIFLMVIVAGCIIGVRLGIPAGHRRREEFIRRLKEKENSANRESARAAKSVQ